MMNNKKRKKRILILIVLVSFAFFCSSLGYAIINNKKSKALGDTIIVGDINRKVSTSIQEGRNLSEELRNLKSNYNEAAMWLKVPGTSIDFPIFQSGDNDRYLRNNRDNKKTKWGEPFLDYRCDISKIESPGNYIIYGHNSETDDNFTPLLNYKQKSFYEAHSTIELATAEKDYTFDIFSAYITDTKFYYIQTEFENTQEYQSYIDSVKQKSKYDTNINLSTNDTILTLSTCDYSIGNGRFVVQAKLRK